MTTMTTIPDQQNPLVFTRYLYPKEEVKHSLLLSLLERQLDEALFWTYELYYSGLENELWRFIESIYNEFYALSNHPSLGKCLSSLYEKWCDEPDDDIIFGTMIKNLINRTFNVNQFMEIYLHVKCDPIKVCIKPGKFLRLTISPEFVEKYRTIDAEEGKARLVLQQACQYPIRKNYNVLFKCSNLDITDLYRLHWLYYCWDCPLWRQRMKDYGGIVNHEKRSIDFHDEDKEETFYDLYGYEPDEQPLEIRSKNIGTGQEKQITIKEFSEKFGGTMQKKTIKISGSILNRQVSEAVHDHC